MLTGRFHIIIDVDKISPKILNDENGLKKFLVHLTKKVEMNVLYGPVVVSGIPENPGLSGFVIIDFSHISIHTFTKYNEAQVDIFSCKAFDRNKAQKEVLSYFKISKLNFRYQEVCWK